MVWWKGPVSHGDNVLYLPTWTDLCCHKKQLVIMNSLIFFSEKEAWDDNAWRATMIFALLLFIYGQQHFISAIFESICTQTKTDNDTFRTNETEPLAFGTIYSPFCREEWQQGIYWKCLMVRWTPMHSCTIHECRHCFFPVWVRDNASCGVRSIPFA